MLKSKDRTQSGRKEQRYAKLSPELKAEVGRRAAEHAAIYSQVIRDCWAMGVVNINLEIGGASTAWRSSKIKSRKV